MTGARRVLVSGALAIAAGMCVSCEVKPNRVERDTTPAASAPPGAETLPPRPRYPEPEQSPLHDGPLTNLSPFKLASFFVGDIGGTRVLVLADSKELPERWRSQVALGRLARRLGIGVVPPTIARAFPLRDLLNAASKDARTRLTENAAVRPDGRVQCAVLALPADTTTRNALYSVEAARWAKLAGSTEPPAGDEARAVEDYIGLLALDFVAGNILRSTFEEAGARLHALDNRSAFDHPGPGASDLILDRLKRVTRFPRKLLAALRALDERRCDEDFRAGDFDDWLVQERMILETLARARALATLIEARVVERGEDAFLAETPARSLPSAPAK